MSNVIANQKRLIVQVAQTIPSSDSGWTTKPELIPLECEEQCGQVVGHLTLMLHASYGWLPGRQGVDAPATRAMTNYTGYVRLLIADGAGTITLVGSGYAGTYTAIWYGVFAAQESQPDGASTNPGGVAQYTCQGLVAILDTIYVNRGYEWDYSSGGVVDPGFCPAFNLNMANGVFGDRYNGSATINGHASIPVHDRTAAAVPWTAKQVVQLLLAGFAQQTTVLAPSTVLGATWVLNCVQTTNLDFVVDKLDFNGRTVLECLNAIINPRRGNIWYITVSGQTVTVNVMSTSSVAITAGSGGISQPANAATCALDTRGNPMMSDLHIVQDTSAQYEDIRVEGDQPLVGISLNWNYANGRAVPTTPLIAGWDLSLEAAWANNPADPSQIYSFMYRRFYLNPGWNGSQFPNSTLYGMLNYRDYDATGSISGQPYGVGGFTGLRDFVDSGGGIVPGANGNVTIDKVTPISPLSSGAPIANPLKSFLAPLLFLYNPTLGVYRDITDEYSITIEENPAAIIIDGHNHNYDLYFDLSLGWELVITLGIRCSAPLMVSYLAPSANWARDLPRCLIKRLPYLQKWVVLHDTVLGVQLAASPGVYRANGDGFIKSSPGLNVVDDTSKLRGHLAFLRAWHTQPLVSVSWMDHSQIDYSYAAGAFCPGAMLTTVQRGDAAVTANAVVTGRKWIFQDGAVFGTAYTSQRLIPDIDAIDQHPMLYRLVKSVDEKAAEMGL